jgi:hypothetical protein
MSLDAPQKNKMMTAAPEKKEFHFSGDGIFHNLTILAENMEAATKEWLTTRQPIEPASQSTPIAPNTPTEEVQ